MRDAGVWIAGDDAAGVIARAVQDGGGTLASADEASVILWVDGSPESIREHLHPGIEWVQLIAAGIEEWFAADIVDSRRLWTAAKGVYASPIAEYILAMMLANARQLRDVLSTPGWRHVQVQSVSGRAVGIVGAGGVGRATLRLLEPFDVHTMALTRSGCRILEADESFGPEGLDYLLASSDYVVLATPETPETVGLITQRRLGTMRRGAFLINVGRGTLVDTQGLVDAIACGHLSGAALDVTDPEPLPDGHPLWSLPNTIITSHTACPPDLALDLLARRVSENVSRFRGGEAMLGVVDIAAGY